MSIELAICHAVAVRLSFHNAAEGDDWSRERGGRNRAYNAWLECRKWLEERGELEAFLKAGGYLV